MKKVIFFLSLGFLYSLAWGEDCSYLKNITWFVPDSAPGQFNYLYNINLCEENAPIHAEIEEYLQWIRKTENKKPVDLIRDAGNVFCRGYFWGCDEKSFYGRFLLSCQNARVKAVNNLSTENRIASVNTEFYLDSFAGCSTLAESYLIAYKQAAFEEIALHHKNMVEQSNEKYFQSTYEKKNALLGTMQTFLKKMGNISRSFEGYAREVFK